jgi:hypothetical protein
MTNTPHFPRHDGVWNSNLQCVIATWRDVGRNLVGFLYRWEDNRVAIIYFSVDDSGYTYRVHHTAAHYVDDPAFVSGWRLDTLPNPDNDPAVGKDFTISKTVLGM